MHTTQKQKFFAITGIASLSLLALGIILFSEEIFNNLKSLENLEGEANHSSEMTFAESKPAGLPDLAALPSPERGSRSVVNGDRSKAGTVLLQGFEPNGSIGEWEIKNWEMASVDPTEGKNTFLASAQYWQSAPFVVPLLHFFRIEVETKGPGTVWVGGMGFNPSASWGRYPHILATSGELVADDWTSWNSVSDNEWEKRVFFTRALGHSTSSAVRLMGDGVLFRNLLVTTASNDEVCEWADAIYTQEMVELGWVPSASITDTCPFARERLRAGQILRVALVGDSIMNDLANSTCDALLRRRFPKSSIEIINAVGGGTGADDWLNDAETTWPRHDLDLNAAVIRTLPDLVIIGGISNGKSWRSDIAQLVSRIRDESYSLRGSSPDFLLVSGAFGSGKDSLDYELGLSDLASEMGCGFLPLRSITESYFESAAKSHYPKSHFYRDDIHANHRGKQLLGRILLTFFSEGERDSH